MEWRVLTVNLQPLATSRTAIMNKHVRLLLLSATLATVLAACATTAANPPASDEPSAPAEPSQPAPSQAPSERPSEPPVPSQPEAPVPSGTLTVIGAAVDGPGEPLSEALAGDLTNPAFVRGVLYLDEDGVVWMADSLLDASVPTFGDVRVMVANHPTDGPMWDMAEAEITGLQEANGIRFYEDAKLYGTITR
jgi:hypothetical protein